MTTPRGSSGLFILSMEIPDMGGGVGLDPDAIEKP